MTRHRMKSRKPRPVPPQMFYSPFHQRRQPIFAIPVVTVPPSKPDDTKSVDNASIASQCVLDRIVSAIMSTRLTVANLPNLRKSSLALQRINSRVTGNDSGGNSGHDGFDDLRTYIKSGGEFSKELAATLSDRADLEANYAKGLQKLAAKLFKASNELSSGTVANAWHFVAEDMAATSETHRTIATLLTEDLVKPLRSFSENQHRSRKSVESSVDKRVRSLTEWRGNETKTKAKCYTVCKENERVQDAVLDCKLGRGRVLSDKELIKLDGKRKKSEEAVRKCDLEYYSSCLKAERARLEWESAVLKGCSTFRKMEEERLGQLQYLAEQYHQTMADNRPKLVASSNRLEEPIRSCDVVRDMATVRKKVEIDEDSLGSQCLPNFYAEDQTNSMNRERRREALAKFLRVVKADVERENKGMAGVENLAKALQETPKFGGEESQQDVQEKLLHMRSMLTFLEATRYKVLNSMLEMEGRPRLSHPLGAYIDQGKDKSGMATSTLRIPYWTRQEAQPPVDLSDEDICVVGSVTVGLPTTTTNSNNSSAVDIVRGTADGGFADLATSDFTTTVIHHNVRGTADGGGELGHHVDNDSDFDEFSDGDGSGSNGSVLPSSGSDSTAPSSHNVVTVTTGGGSGVNGFVSSSSSGFGSHHSGGQEENEISEIYYQEKQVPSIGTCRALYDYTANMYDELSIRVGDVINIHDKQEDGWWLGELKGTVGIFPATYVEENVR